MFNFIQQGLTRSEDLHAFVYKKKKKKKSAF